MTEGVASAPMPNVSVVRDAKEQASMTFRNVIETTRENFPDKKYRPDAKGGVSSGAHALTTNSDGTGTKPELAERLAFETKDPRFFEGNAFDAAAMVVDDAARDGYFVVGVSNSVDVNDADEPFATALAHGLKRACDTGRFSLLNGETAELGYRTPGFGKWHLNWNMTALAIKNEAKAIDGAKLRPGMSVVGLREKSIRSNGLSRARAILEHAYLAMHGEHSKTQHVVNALRDTLLKVLLPERAYENTQIGERLYTERALGDVRNNLYAHLNEANLGALLEEAFPGNDLLGQIQLPWHRAFPEITEKLLTPSTIYAPLIHEAQGGVDGKVKIPIVANAHVSGGGIPLKGQRMLKGRGIGLDLDTVFPDPEGVHDVMRLAQRFPKSTPRGVLPLVDDRTACEQWNRGVGFLTVLENGVHASDFIRLAESMGYEAAHMGVTVGYPLIRWRGHEWRLDAA